MSTLRFYGENIDGFIVPMPGQKVEEVFQEIKIPLPAHSETNFFEVQLSLDETETASIKPLDTDYIRPAALQAASDYNEQVIIQMSETQRETNYFTNKFLLQDVIDRCLLYKEDFTLELEQLLLKYPLDVSTERTDLGNTRIVKKA